MNTTHPPVGPTEAEVRDHFGNKLTPDAKLMRPAYTSVWALEDGRLLWDWKNGYARIGQKLQCIVYVTGPPASGKTRLAKMLTNSREVNLKSSLSHMGGNLLRRVEENVNFETVVFTSQAFHSYASMELNRIAEELGIQFFNINLTHK